MSNKKLREFIRILVLVGSAFLVYKANDMAWGNLLASFPNASTATVVSYSIWIYIQLATWFFILNVFHPSYTLIFDPNTKVRHPKTIIKLGDRFRGVGLPAPQFFLWTDPGKIQTPSHFSGYSILPKPFGALLMMPEKYFTNLTLDELDVYICREAADSKFGNRFIAIQKYLLLYLILFLLLWALVFTPYMIFIPDNMHVFVIAAFAGIAFVSLIFLTAWSRDRYVFAKDFQAIQIYNLLPDFFFHTLQKMEGEVQERKFLQKIWRPPTVSERAEKYKLETIVLESDTQRLPWYFALKPRRSAIAIGFVFLVADWMSPYVYYQNYHRHNRYWTHALQTKNHAMVAKLLSQGKDLKIRDPFYNGATPLLIAIEAGDLNNIYSLLVAGSKMDETDDLKRGILYYAFRSSEREKVVKYLLQGKVNVNYVDGEGRSALDYAHYYNSADLEKVLLNAGAQARMPASLPNK